MTITATHAFTRTTAGPDVAPPAHPDPRSGFGVRRPRPESLHPTSELASTVLSLASIARAATRAVGFDACTDLVSGPGVMVVRDLVAAVQVLEIAVARATHADRQQLRPLVPSATGMSAALLELIG